MLPCQSLYSSHHRSAEDSGCPRLETGLWWLCRCWMFSTPTPRLWPGHLRTQSNTESAVTHSFKILHQTPSQAPEPCNCEEAVCWHSQTQHELAGQWTRMFRIYKLKQWRKKKMQLELHRITKEMHPEHRNCQPLWITVIHEGHHGISNTQKGIKISISSWSQDCLWIGLNESAAVTWVLSHLPCVHSAHMNYPACTIPLSYCKLLFLHHFQFLCML